MTGSQVRVLFAAPYLPDRFSPPPSISDQRNRRAPTWRGILLVWPFACRACRQWRRPGDGGRNECSCGRPQHYRRAPLSANEMEPVATRPRSARIVFEWGGYGCATNRCISERGPTRRFKNPAISTASRWRANCLGRAATGASHFLQIDMQAPATLLSDSPT